MFEINAMPPQLPEDLVADALAVEPATIGHFRLLGFPDRGIRPLFPVKRVCGVAVTLALPGADSTLLHHAVGFIRPGDILLVDRLGDNRFACLGGGVAYALVQARVGAIIIDGLCADPDEIRELGVPVFARGFSSITTRLLGSGGHMNVPICCGGAVVMPGDLIIADEGGIVILSPASARADIDRARKMQEAEKSGLLPALDTGEPLGELSGATQMVLAKLAPT